MKIDRLLIRLRAALLFAAEICDGFVVMVVALTGDRVANGH